MHDVDDLAALAQGDMTAFDALYREHKDAVHAYACSLVGPGAEAEDLTQEAFLGMLRCAASAAPRRSTLRAYLVASVRNRVVDLRRSAAWRLAARGETPTEGASGAAVAWSPAADREDASRMIAALHDLRPERAETVKLRVFGGLGYEEIGRVLEIPPATARTRYRAAIEELKTAVSEENDGPERDRTGAAPKRTR